MPRTWTPEQRAKQVALIRTWQPWTKSTGAKTDQGKAISSKNACKGYKRAKHRETARRFRDAKTMLDLIEKMEQSDDAENLVLLNAIENLAKRLGF